MEKPSETIADIIATVREQVKLERKTADRLQKQGNGADYAIGCSVEEDANFLESIADRLDAAHKREMATTKKSSAVGNAAKLREALSDACYAMFNFLKAQNGGHEEMASTLDKAKAALAAPARNCDRFGGNIDKLREACARERGLNPEEDLPDVFPDWLLAPATEKEGCAK